MFVATLVLAVVWLVLCADFAPRDLGCRHILHARYSHLPVIRPDAHLQVTGALVHRRVAHLKVLFLPVLVEPRTML